jgi:hypothetical protein
MPQRTNEFQQLIKRVETALHGTQTNVVESAMVHDFDAETDVEIDILVTFSIAGREYRVGIECRDHKRAQGPSWIRDLRTKRDACRLDKIIGVSSSGFSSTAQTAAEKYGIETVHPKEDKTDWIDAITPSKGISSYAMGNANVTEVTLDSPLRTRLPAEVAPKDMIVAFLEPGKGMLLSDVLKHIEKRIVMKHTDDIFNNNEAVGPVTLISIVGFSIECKPNARIAIIKDLPDNKNEQASVIDQDVIKGISGIAILRMGRSLADVRKTLYSNQPIREESFNLRAITDSGAIDTEVKLTLNEHSDIDTNAPQSAVHFNDTGFPIGLLSVGAEPFSFDSTIVEKRLIKGISQPFASGPEKEAVFK